MKQGGKLDGRDVVPASVGVAAVVGALRGLPTIPRLGVGGEWVLVPAVLALVAWLRRSSLPAEFRAAVRADRMLVLLVVADAAWATVAAAWSPARGQALAEVLRGWLTSASVLVFAALLRDRPRALGLSILAAGSVLGVLALAGAAASHFGIRTPFVEAAPHSEVNTWSRATGVFGTPATFGALMLGVAGVALVARARGLIGIASGRACLALVGLAGAASVSIPGVGCVMVVLWAALAPHARRAALVVVAALTLAATVVIYTHVHAAALGDWYWRRPPEAGYEPLGFTEHPLRTTRLGPAQFEWHRTGYSRIHRAHLETLRAHPLGIGTASFPRVDTGPTLRTNGHWSRHGHPHAWVMMRASEGGVVGFLIALALWGWGGVRCWRRAWKDGDAAIRGMAVVIGAFLWASWFGDFLHRWDVALLAAAAIVLRESAGPARDSAGLAPQPAGRAPPQNA